MVQGHSLIVWQSKKREKITEKHIDNKSKYDGLMTPKNECLVPSNMGKSLCVVKTGDLMHDLTHTRQHSATGLHT